MKPLRQPGYVTKEQIVRGTREAARLGFAAFENHFLRSLTKPRYRVYAAWLHTNGEGFSDVVRVQFFLDPRNPSPTRMTQLDVTHDLYADMLNNPIDRAAEKLLSNTIYEVRLPTPVTEKGFKVNVRGYANGESLDDIMIGIMDHRLPEWRRILGRRFFIHEVWRDDIRADYVGYQQNGRWVVRPCVGGNNRRT